MSAGELGRGGMRGGGGRATVARRTRHARPTVSLVVGAALVAGVVLACLVSLAWTPYDPDAMSLTQRFSAPTSEHLLGTDQYGRDILSRTMVSAQAALLVGLGSVSLGALAGTIVGTTAAMSARGVRAVIMRVVEGLMAFPGILLALVLVLVIGRGLTSSLVAIAVFMVPTFARLTYSLAMEARGTLYVKAARSYGSSPVRIVARQILPNMLPRIVTQLTSSVGTAMLLESSLSFLGLGVQPPTASWGNMLQEALQYALTFPGVALAPGCALMLAVLGFNLLGDGLNDLLVRRGAR